MIFEPTWWLATKGTRCLKYGTRLRPGFFMPIGADSLLQEAQVACDESLELDASVGVLGQELGPGVSTLGLLWGNRGSCVA